MVKDLGIVVNYFVEPCFLGLFFFFREGKFVKLPKIEGLGCDGAVPGPQCRPSAVENGRIGL